MRVEGLLFGLLAAFLLASAAIYWPLAGEPTGFVCLLLSGGFALMVSYYSLFIAARMDARPEDREDAEIAEGAGEVGFFSPHSWWPILLAGAFTLTTLGLIFGTFIVIIGFVCVVLAAAGLVFEYYVGINRTQGETLSTVAATGNTPTSNRKFLGEGVAD